VDLRWEFTGPTGRKECDVETGAVPDAHREIPFAAVTEPQAIPAAKAVLLDKDTPVQRKHQDP
jgi:hypothetical protein